MATSGYPRNAATTITLNSQPFYVQHTRTAVVHITVAFSVPANPSVSFLANGTKRRRTTIDRPMERTTLAAFTVPAFRRGLCLSATYTLSSHISRQSNWLWTRKISTDRRSPDWRRRRESDLFSSPLPLLNWLSLLPAVILHWRRTSRPTLLLFAQKQASRSISATSSGWLSVSPASVTLTPV